jgi:thioesterase domain-containing protein
LFCIPGGGGPALALRALADAVDGHPFYGIQAHGLEESTRPDRTVEAIAVRNIAALRAIQPHGPYALGGHSFGGLVAFEMACRLRAVGEPVDLLALLDAAAPRPRTWQDGWSRRMRHLRAVRASGSLGVGYPAVSAVRGSLASVRAGYDRVRADAVAATAGRLTRHGLAQYSAFYELHVVAARRYRPTATFDGDVLVLRAEGTDDLGWSRYATGRVTVVEVPGDHLSLLRPPAVTEVGRQLAARLG